ncbi:MULTISPECIES: hypothetical protein [Fischerella]|nr:MULTISPECIES: hypothetical protein [Fischerella]
MMLAFIAHVFGAEIAANVQLYAEYFPATTIYGRPFERKDVSEYIRELMGLQLGATWDDSRAIIQLAGNLGNQPAAPFSAMVQVGDIAPVQLAFAWTKSLNVPLILGQTNFFMEFYVCFYRSKMEFEVKPKSP